MNSLSLSKGSSWTWNWPGVYCIAGGFFTHWAITDANAMFLLALHPPLSAILTGRYMEVAGGSFKLCVCVCVCVCGVSCLVVSVTLWTVARQAPLCMEFSRQEYWNGLLSLLQGIFPSEELNLGLVHFRQIPYHLSHQASPPNFLVTQLLLTHFLSSLEFKEPPSLSFGLFWNG